MVNCEDWRYWYISALLSNRITLEGEDGRGREEREGGEEGKGGEEREGGEGGRRGGEKGEETIG